MKSIATKAIVLKRINYAEADRIITFLTPDIGQVRAIAKGVRKPRSKMAGGVELLSVCDVVFMDTRGDLKLLRSARIDEHYGEIVKDYDRMQTAYMLIEAAYTLSTALDEPQTYEILKSGLSSLNNTGISLNVTKLWFILAMLMLMGQQPNLNSDDLGNKLDEDLNYSFDPSSAAFVIRDSGKFTADHIKVARLLIKTPPQISLQVKGLDKPAQDLSSPVSQMFERILKLGTPG